MLAVINLKSARRLAAIVMTIFAWACSSSDATGTGGEGTADVPAEGDGIERDVAFPTTDATPGPSADGAGGPDTTVDGQTGPDTGEVSTCGDFGASCTDNGECCSGFCVETFDGALQCTIGCVSECPEGFSCQVNLASYPDVQTVCVPKISKLCRECKSDLQCAGGACVPIGDGDHCTVDCSTNPCPSGYECTELESGAQGCIPTNGSCDCSPNTAGAERPCAVKNEFGVCNGLEVCDPSSGWGTCDADIPKDEICNGLDDDCNGLADEDFKDPIPCEATVEGLGTCTGIASCQGPLGWVCSASAPTAEGCDFVDNDCDGVTDEDFKNLEGRYVDLNHCGSCNKDCAGIFPNAIARCDGDKPVPQCVVDACDNGYYKANDFQCLPQYDTVCQPCTVDFQCGGGVCVRVGSGGYCAEKCGAGGGVCNSGSLCKAATDPQGAPKGQACLPVSGDCTCTSATQGASRPCSSSGGGATCYGFETCDALVGWSECSAQPPSAESCNGLDDDCDGIVDDGLTDGEPCENSVAGIGTCQGQSVCQGKLGWVCSAAQPIPELCDFKDNDCDGQTDEAFKNAQGKYTSNQHCGQCGASCQGTVPNASAKCDTDANQPVCIVDACEEGFYKLNDYVCLPDGETTCRSCSSDAQCDGMQCVDVDGGDFCVPPCDSDADCSSGYTCSAGKNATSGAAGTFCIPDNGTCDCRVITQGAKRACEVTNELGTCVAFELCDAASGWGQCGAKEATAEICDGLDNDCDGLIDNGIPSTKPCSVSNAFGTCGGTATCVGAQGYVCNANTPEADVCNFLDDDCDGQTDEDFKNAAGKYGSDDHCGGCGVVCDDIIDNAASEKCDATKSKPVCVVDECQDGFFKLNDFQCVVQPDVGCIPCKGDSDCFGAKCTTLGDGKFCVENCTSVSDCEPGFLCDKAPGASSGSCVPASGACDCTVATAGAKRLCSVENDVGTCVGFSSCDPEQGWSACDAGTPGEEVCNGLDDDCNGIVDDDVAASTPCENSNAIGTCNGESICQGGLGYVCKAPIPAVESCDFKDNDCDGTVDDGFVDAEGRYVSQNHCGTCGKSCGSTVANSLGEKCDTTKAVPQCVASACKPGYFLLNELQCIPNPAVQCSPCVSDDTCFGGKCQTVGAGKFCLETCSSAADCDSDFGCSQGVCVPNVGSCDCTPANAGKKRTCEVKNSIGSCLGFETCDAAAGWTGCTATVAETERCDGLDNDCNGLIDDGLPETQNCFKKNVYGQCAGLSRCFGAAGWVCQADEPAPEVCDFKNNDCDLDAAGKSQVDEDFRDENGRYTTAAHCGTCGLACGDQYENSATESCDATKSVPQCVIETCDPGFIKLNDYQCIEVPDVLCEPCSSDANCFGEQCVTVDTGSFCLTDCGPGKPACPSDYSCIAGLCRPQNGTCDCREETDGDKRTCKATNELGICYGFETCVPASGWDTCDAIAPFDEVCNGVDDDCDGFIDDGLPSSIPCESQPNQYGTCSGQATCFGTVGWFCTAPIASAEVCDYKDNDCDGLTDEGFVNAQGKYASDAHCGECGNDCGQEILNGSSSCDVTKPVPQCVVEECDNGWQKFNDFLCIPIVASLCEPCATDENCVGPGSRCVPLNDGSACGIACDDDSDCSSGYHCYDVGIGAKQCVPLTGSCDCDGSNTDLQEACQVTLTPPGGGSSTLCFGTDYCTATGWSGCITPAEVCNNADDDCDGLIDEAFKDAVGKYASAEHCGKCNRNCEQLTYENAVGVCLTTLETPNCGYQCVSGYVDVNLNPGDGCECEILSSTDYVDGLDQNCDGIDGDVELGVFVSKTGNDANIGSRALPKRTIQAAISAAASAPVGTKRDVYVATGVYGESILMAAGISVYGGYNGDYSARSTAVYETALIASQPDVQKPGAVNAVNISGAGEKTVFSGFTVFGSDNLQPGRSSYTIYIRNSDSRVSVKNNRVIAGSGGDGASGAKGADGASGPAGGNGVRATNFASCTANQKLTSGGSGGVNTCKGISTSGGRGGEGYCPNNGGTDNVNESGAAGSNGAAAGGGSGYDPAIAAADFTCFGDGCGLCIVSGTKSSDGAVGAEGAAGAHGALGVGCSLTAGTVVGGEWVAGSGSDGGTGLPGGGGGGGGAGGGVDVCGCASSNGGSDAGGTGGGGGAGGCGADLGKAGSGGGGSFGVFLVWDSVPSSVPEVAQNAIQRANGGRGGVGGNAGVGGIGGKSGLGGLEGDTANLTWCSGSGEAGGKGGDGGHGGGGGGGCGGSSYALYASGQGSLSLAAIKSSNQLLPGGAGGTGGQGGLSLKNSGSKGADGAFSLANF